MSIEVLVGSHASARLIKSIAHALTLQQSLNFSKGLQTHKDTSVFFQPRNVDAFSKSDDQRGTFPCHGDCSKQRDEPTAWEMPDRGVDSKTAYTVKFNDIVLTRRSWLGHGKFGEVWEYVAANHVQGTIGFSVTQPTRLAVKFAPREKDGDLLEHERNVLRAIEREARSLSPDESHLADHVMRSIPEILTDTRDVPILALQFVEGETLQQHFQVLGFERPITPEEVFDCAVQVLQAIAFLEERCGLYTLDRHQRNTMLSNEGVAKLIDFGGAVFKEPSEEDRRFNVSKAIDWAIAGKWLSPKYRTQRSKEHCIELSKHAISKFYRAKDVYEVFVQVKEFLEAEGS